VVLLRRGEPTLPQIFDQYISAAGFVTQPCGADRAGAALDAHRRCGKAGEHPARLDLGDWAAYALATSLDLPLLDIGNDFTHTDVISAL